MSVLRFFLFLLFSGLMSAQVGIGTDTPDPAAVLDVNSEISTGVYGGLKLPTVSLAQRSTIATPIPDGLMLYVVDGSTRCVQIYDGNSSSWMNFYCMNNVPEASSVAITGAFEVEENLTGTYTYSDVENDLEATSTFQWYRADDAAGTNLTPIAGETSNTYTLLPADAGFYIAYEVTPIAATGSINGLPVLSTFNLVSYKDVEVNFNQQSQVITENAANDDVQLSFSLSNTSYSSITLTITANDYSRLDETTSATVIIPANATSPYTTTVAPFNVNDNAAIDGTANITFTITAISGGTGTTTIGVTNTDTLQINDDDGVPVLLAIQDFEVTPASPTLPLTINNAGAYQTGTARGTAANQDTFIGARSYGCNNDLVDLDLGPVDASAYTTATLQFQLGSYSYTTGNGADAADYIAIYISTDGGATFSYELDISGNSNARYDLGVTTGYSLVYDGDNVGVSVTTPTLGAGYSDIEITGIPNSNNLVVGFLIENNSADELWVIDNVEIYGNP
ncbi:MAG: hypothetical protein ACSHWW_10520 [Nonlabens sp.]|uniref:hypothetical protein n=1 Tax=Nonlabens sp. TaxID=1888209 RepID=UPI003EFB3B1A